MWQVAQHGPSDILRGYTVVTEAESQRVLRKFNLPIDSGRDPVQDTGATAAQESLESGQGFASSAEIRQAVETHSMRRAAEYFKDRGFQITDVSANHPYDLRCEQGDLTVHVEVKGTQTGGRQVILTANEVEFARTHSDRLVLFVLHSISVSEGPEGQIQTRDGTREVHMPWEVDQGVLSAISYRYEPPNP